MSESGTAMVTTSRMPGPPPANSIFAAYALMKAVRKDLLGLITQSFVDHGDVFCLEVLGRKQVLAIAPAQIRELLVEHAASFEKGFDYTDRRKGLAKFGGSGLITSNGAFWKRQRKLVAPALHHKRIASYGQAMIDAALRVSNGWQDGQIIEVDHAMMKAALDIVARTMFDADLAEDADRIAAATHTLHGMFEANNSVWTLLPGWFPTLQRMRENAAVRTLDEIVYRLIRERRPDPKGPVREGNDLASMLLSAETEDGERMSDREARDEIVTMFIAGHETAANTLSWTFLLLAKHPEVEAKLHQELDRVLGASHRDPTPDDCRSLLYAEAVIKESLRLYPPAFTVMRHCNADVTLGGHLVKKGMDVSLVPYATHRDARFFPDPLRFDPERFLGEREKTIDRYAWIPFGGGPRVCVGNAFAMMETTLVLATIASRFRLTLADGVELVPVPGVTLRPEGPVRMGLQRR